MLYYHRISLFISFSSHLTHPYGTTQNEGPQKVWVEVQRAQSAKPCNSFELCLHRAVHVCFHALSHRSNQTAFRHILLSLIISRLADTIA